MYSLSWEVGLSILFNMKAGITWSRISKLAFKFPNLKLLFIHCFIMIKVLVPTSSYSITLPEIEW